MGLGEGGLFNLLGLAFGGPGKKTTGSGEGKKNSRHGQFFEISWWSGGQTWQEEWDGGNVEHERVAGTKI